MESVFETEDLNKSHNIAFFVLLFVIFVLNIIALSLIFANPKIQETGTETGTGGTGTGGTGTGGTGTGGTGGTGDICNKPCNPTCDANSICQCVTSNGQCICKCMAKEPLNLAKWNLISYKLDVNPNGTKVTFQPNTLFNFTQSSDNNNSYKLFLVFPDNIPNGTTIIISNNSKNYLKLISDSSNNLDVFEYENIALNSGIAISRSSMIHYYKDDSNKIQLLIIDY